MIERRHGDRRRADLVNPYLLGVVAVATIGIVVVAIIVVLRDRMEAAAIVASILGFLAPVVLALVALLKEQKGRRSIRPHQREARRHDDAVPPDITRRDDRGD